MGFAIWLEWLLWIIIYIFFLFFKISNDVEKPVITDIDTDTVDEFAMAEYANEIFKNMRKREVINEGHKYKYHVNNLVSTVVSTVGI